LIARNQDNERSHAEVRAISFIKRAGSIFLTDIGSAVIGMATSILVARYLGPEMRGYYGLVLLAVGTLTAFGHLGLGSAIAYYTGKNEIPRGEIMTFLVVSSLVIGSVLAAAFLIVYPYIPEIWTGIPRSIMLIGLLAVPFTFFQSYLMRFSLAMFKVKEKNIISFLNTLSYLVMITIVIVLMRKGYAAAVFSSTAAIAVSTAVGFALVARSVRPAKQFNTSLLRPFLTYGSMAYAIMVLNFFNRRVDVYLVKHFLTVSDVAFYQIAVSMAERLWMIPNTLDAILYPTLMTTDKDPSKFTAMVCRNNLFIGALLSGCLAFGARILVVPLYGPDFAAVTNVIYSLLLGVTVAPLSVFLWTFFATRNQLRIGVFASAVGTVSTLILNFLLIPRMGIIGAGLAMSTSLCVTAAVLIAIFTRRTGASLRETLIVNRDDFRMYRVKIKEGLRYVRRRLSRKMNIIPPLNGRGE